MLTYEKSGVSIKKASLFKKEIAGLVRKTNRPGVLNGIGGFGGLFKLPEKGYKNPILVSSSDGVGTKLKIAILANQHDTIGIDCVAMNVNDILCTGAEPLFFLDYIAYSKLSSQALTQIIKGLSRGCVQAGCSLIGGETAQMPDMYANGDYDVAGFCVGVVEKNKIIDGSRISPDDVLIGIASSGLHSNGFSLARKVFSSSELKKYTSQLLAPTRIYVKPVLSLLQDKRLKNAISGIAHITGGAFYDKVARILPKNADAYINKDSWGVPKIFKLIQNKGSVAEKEMYHTFNMGIGMVLIVKPFAAEYIKCALSGFKLKSYLIGKISKGKKQVVMV